MQICDKKQNVGCIVRIDSGKVTGLHKGYIGKAHSVFPQVSLVKAPGDRVVTDKTAF